MHSIDQDTFVSLVEQAAKKTCEIEHSCSGALLIGSQAAHIRSEHQRKPKDSADWDFIVLPSYFLSWISSTSRELHQIEIPSSHLNSTSQNEAKKSIFSNIFSRVSQEPASSKPTLSSNVECLSVRITLVHKETFFSSQKWVIDFEIPTTINCSSAQILLHAFSDDNPDQIDMPFDDALQAQVASLEILLALKKSTFHPTRWLKHTEDFHHLVKEVGNKPFSEKLTKIIELRRKESAEIHKIKIKEIDSFDLDSLIKVDTTVRQLLAKYNSKSNKITRTQLEKESNENIQLVGGIILAYTQQNKISSSFSSMQILATSKSPSIWWTNFLQEQFPSLQQLLLSTIPTILEESKTTENVPSTWIFPQLPLDIALIIASYIGITSHYQASKIASVSRSWKTFFNNDFMWKLMFQKKWTGAQPVDNLSWKSNFLIRKNLESRNTNPSKLEEHIRITAKFQRTTVDDLLHLWKDLLRISQPSENSLKACLSNIYRLQWMIQHTFVYNSSQADALDDYSPSSCSMDFAIGCSELPKFRHKYLLVHMYGERGSSRYSIESHEIGVNREGQNRFRKFDNPSLYGLRYSKWGLVGDLTENSELSMENSPLFDLPEGIITAFFIQLAECQMHVKSYFKKDYTSLMSSY